MLLCVTVVLTVPPSSSHANASPFLANSTRWPTCFCDSSSVLRRPHPQLPRGRPDCVSQYLVDRCLHCLAVTSPPMPQHCNTFCTSLPREGGWDCGVCWSLSSHPLGSAVACHFAANKQHFVHFFLSLVFLFRFHVGHPLPMHFLSREVVHCVRGKTKILKRTRFLCQF